MLVCRRNVLGVKELVLSKSEDIFYGALNESVFYALLRRGVRRVAGKLWYVLRKRMKAIRNEEAELLPPGKLLTL